MGIPSQWSPPGLTRHLATLPVVPIPLYPTEPTNLRDREWYGLPGTSKPADNSGRCSETRQSKSCSFCDGSAKEPPSHPIVCPRK